MLRKYIDIYKHIEVHRMYQNSIPEVLWTPSVCCNFLSTGCSDLFGCRGGRRRDDLLHKSFRSLTSWLVGQGHPVLKNDGLRQLGWWHTPNINGKIQNWWQPNHQPVVACWFWHIRLSRNWEQCLRAKSRFSICHAPNSRWRLAWSPTPGASLVTSLTPCPWGALLITAPLQLKHGKTQVAGAASDPILEPLLCFSHTLIVL